MRELLPLLPVPPAGDIWGAETSSRRQLTSHPWSRIANQVGRDVGHTAGWFSDAFLILWAGRLISWKTPRFSRRRRWTRCSGGVGVSLTATWCGPGRP